MIYRLYFNNCADFPQIWSIDEGTTETEVNVIGFGIEAGCEARSARVPDFKAIDRGREPVCWVEVTAAQVWIEQGVALFRAAKT